MLWECFLSRLDAAKNKEILEKNLKRAAKKTGNSSQILLPTGQ